MEARKQFRSESTGRHGIRGYRRDGGRLSLVQQPDVFSEQSSSTSMKRPQHQNLTQYDTTEHQLHQRSRHPVAEEEEHRQATSSPTERGDTFTPPRRDAAASCHRDRSPPPPHHQEWGSDGRSKPAPSSPEKQRQRQRRRRQQQRKQKSPSSKQHKQRRQKQRSTKHDLQQQHQEQNAHSSKQQHAQQRHLDVQQGHQQHYNQQQQQQSEVLRTSPREHEQALNDHHHAGYRTPPPVNHRSSYASHCRSQRDDHGNYPEISLKKQRRKKKLTTDAARGVVAEIIIDDRELGVNTKRRTSSRLKKRSRDKKNAVNHVKESFDGDNLDFTSHNSTLSTKSTPLPSSEDHIENSGVPKNEEYLMPYDQVYGGEHQTEYEIHLQHQHPVEALVSKNFFQLFYRVTSTLCSFEWYLLI